LFSWFGFVLPSITGVDTVGHSEWNNNDFTASGSSSNTDFADHEVHVSHLEESFISPVSGVVNFVTETVTVFVTVHVTFGSTSSVSDDFDFVVTSGFHEWSTSWHGESEEGVTWDSSSSDVDLEGVKSFSTVVHEGKTSSSRLGSIVFRDPKWHGWKDVHVVSWELSWNGEDVMVDHGGEEVSIRRGLHLEESLHEELVGVSRSETTSTSNSGPMAWHGEEGISIGTLGEGPVHVPWSDVSTSTSKDSSRSLVGRLGMDDEISGRSIDNGKSGSSRSSNGLGLEDEDITNSSTSTETSTFSN